MDEVFGKEHFVAEIVFLKTSGQTSKFLPPANDYLIWYSKDIQRLEHKYRCLFRERDEDFIDAAYNYLELPDGKIIKLTKGWKLEPYLMP